MRLVSASDREKQLRNSYAGSGVSFVKWVGRYKGARSRVVMRCDTHGEWETGLNPLIYKNSGCPLCCASSPIIENDAVSILTERLSVRGHHFVGFDKGFAGSCSRVMAKCDIHGEWTTDYQNIVLALTGCPSCAHNRQPDRTERENDISCKIQGTGWRISGWVDEDNITAFSKIMMYCPDHGKWLSNPNAILSKGYGCPGCATSGFNKNAPATTYCLVSECRQFVKIGITNNLDTRLKSLRRATPFGFDIVERFDFENGELCAVFERLMLDKFDSAGFTGFDGATEWVKWNHEITAWFRLMNHTATAPMPTRLRNL